MSEPILTLVEQDNVTGGDVKAIRKLEAAILRLVEPGDQVRFPVVPFEVDRATLDQFLEKHKKLLPLKNRKTMSNKLLWKLVHLVKKYKEVQEEQAEQKKLLEERVIAIKTPYGNTEYFAVQPQGWGLLDNLLPDVKDNVWSLPPYVPPTHSPTMVSARCFYELLGQQMLNEYQVPLRIQQPMMPQHAGFLRPLPQVTPRTTPLFVVHIP